MMLINSVRYVKKIFASTARLYTIKMRLANNLGREEAQTMMELQWMII